MKRLIILLLFPLALQAQNTITLTPSVTQGNGSITTDITWSTSPSIPGASACTASGHPSWTGPRPSSGTQNGIVISTSGTFPIGLTCNFAGDSIVTFSWTNPTQNTDGSAYSNPDIVRIKYTFNPTLSSSPTVAAAGETHVDVPASQTIRTVTGISQTGTLRGAAYARNTLGVYSDASNVAMKVFTGSVPVTQTVSITVNPKPAAPTGFSGN